MKKFVIIDGNSLINRAFYALPMLANFEGEISNAVFGFTNILVKMINELQPEYLCVAFDYGKKTFRNELYSDYKGTRKGTPEELKSQFPILKTVLTAMNIKFIEQEGIEADDIIGTLTKMFDVNNIVLTGDKDAFQLINDNTSVMFTKKGISETVVYDTETLKQEYGILPYQVIEMKSLMGDSSDNIPGVAGVGEKTALNLLTEYETLENVYNNIENIKGKLQEKLIADKDKAFLSRELATIKTDANIKAELKDFTYDYPFNDDVLKLFKKYQFNSLLKRDGIFKNSEGGSVEVKAKVKVNKELLSDLQSVKDLKETLLTKDHFTINISDNIFISYDDREYEINFINDLLQEGLDYSDVFEILKEVLESDTITKTVFDGKSLMNLLNKYNVGLSGIKYDVSLIRYLVNNNAKTNIKFEEMLTEQGFSNQNPAYELGQVGENLFKLLKEYDLSDLYFNVELPLSNVLFDMEIQGFKIDKDELILQDKKYSLLIQDLTEEIYSLAGQEFNINSPKQLGDVLFNKLNIQAFNNKKNSTGIDVLNEIYHKHDIVPKIIEYRKITKLYNTYIKAFLDILSPKTHKIHTVFNQSNTATGRLSSNEPNLQNIPVRSEEGKNFRKVFVSDFEDGLILSADYSQIELRLLAAFSGDEKLIDSFKNGIDIHSKTASEIFEVDLKDVTSDMRRDAKAINFGIIYGISDYGLSQNINSTRKEAKNYIDTYFDRYPKVKEYMDKNINDCRRDGYVKTLLGRKRFILEINSSNYNLRSFGERAAMNMPLQGSASDIIKVAMIKISNKLKEKGLQSKLILQVHDELIIDCKSDELEVVKEILKSEMQNVVDLPVLLEVNLQYGKNWFEA